MFIDKAKILLNQLILNLFFKIEISVNLKIFY